MILLICVSILIGFVGAFLYEYCTGKIDRRFFKKDALIISGYRLHHSLYGLFGLLLSILFFLSGKVGVSTTLLGLSIGVIIQHTITDGFRFLSKEKI